MTKKEHYYKMNTFFYCELCNYNMPIRKSSNRVIERLHTKSKQHTDNLKSQLEIDSDYIFSNEKYSEKENDTHKIINVIDYDGTIKNIIVKKSNNKYGFKK